MGVDVDPSWCGDQPVAVELAVCFGRRATDFGDEVTVDGDVAGEGRPPGSVDDLGSPDHKIMHGE